MSCSCLRPETDSEDDERSRPYKEASDDEKKVEENKISEGTLFPAVVGAAHKSLSNQRDRVKGQHKRRECDIKKERDRLAEKEREKRRQREKQRQASKQRQQQADKQKQRKTGRMKKREK
ncbi:uncharacterized protein O3C94_004777 isoform 1-T2 [Discoglossus pictus]